MEKTDYNKHDYYDIYVPDPPRKEELTPDLITVHISRSQVVRLTEDLLLWMFRKVKGIFKKKKKKVGDE